MTLRLHNCRVLSLCRFSTLKKEFAEKRAEYWRQEKLRESMLDLNKFTEEEKAIYWAHKNAIDKGYFTYNDPFTKDKIWTTYKHFLKGKCCGDACRHCIYDYVSVPDEIKKQRSFNGSFWVNYQSSEERENFFRKLFKIIKIKPK